jgi:flotillin
VADQVKAKIQVIPHHHPGIPGMNVSILILAELSTTTLLIGGVAAFLFVFFMFVGIWAGRYRKVGPDEVMIVSGRKNELITPDGKKAVVGFRLVRGGGTFVWPIYEQVQTLSLKLIPVLLDRATVTAQDGARIEISAKGQIKIGSDEVSIMRAAQALAGKSSSEIGEAATLIVESSLRKLMPSQLATDVLRDSGVLSEKVQSTAQQPLTDLGLELVAFVITAANQA